MAKPSVKEGLKLYRVIGWKRHGKRSLYGHFFSDGVCLDCGLTKKEFTERMK